ncbi:MAG: hypothetical protein OZ921_14390, partial [Sorangiineae bacterium]|nr:hypothetical protein [Sorangiineae bacterium]
MGRVAARALFIGALAVVSLARAEPAGAPAPRPLPARIFADLDDDDADGVADALEPWTAASGADVIPADGVTAVSGDAARLVGGGLQGVRAGQVTLELGAGARAELAVVALAPIDAAGRRLDLAASHASMSRVLPPGLAPEGAPPDADALAWLAVGPPAALPARITLRSWFADGRALDRLEGVALEAVACPPETRLGLACRKSPPIRASTDAVDREHPASRATSILAEAGGRIAVEVDGLKASSIRVGGPRDTPLGPLERLRARLRVHVVRLAPGGAPAIGGDDAGALTLARDQVEIASALFSQCGIHFGLRAKLDVEVVDPPPAHLVAVGCELGLPASGGALALIAGGRKLRVATRAGQTPAEVASSLAVAVRAAGLRATLSPNPRARSGALPTVDVLIRGAGGARVPLAADGETPLSSDATLSACLGAVELADGLRHFTDYDAAAGTVEERSLVKAYDDGDPRTVEVFIVPSFTKLGRVG